MSNYTNHIDYRTRCLAFCINLECKPFKFFFGDSKPATCLQKTIGVRCGSCCLRWCCTFLCGCNKCSDTDSNSDTDPVHESGTDST